MRRLLASLLLVVPVHIISMSGPSAAEPCMDCLEVRVGPPTVVRGPFPDELDAVFNAVQLPDGTIRGFTANGSTYAVDGASLFDMGGARREVLEAGEPGSVNDCGRWLTSNLRIEGRLFGLVHQEANCDYAAGRTDKSMAIAVSDDNGLNWTDLGTVIAGPEAPVDGRINGEGDCTMVNGNDGFLYAYCLRNADWQTIVARAPLASPTAWLKYHEGAWTEPGLGGRATDIGFLGTGAGYLANFGWVATVTTDPWFGGVRLSLSDDKVTFVDFDEPLLTIDGSEWDRPASTDLVAYATILNPKNGSNVVEGDFLLTYVYVPPGKGFESRYLVYQPVSLTKSDRVGAVQAGMALTRWLEPDRKTYVTSTGPLTGDRLGYRRDAVVAYMLTRAPDDAAAIKFEECTRMVAGHIDQVIAYEGSCEASGFTKERTAGWLFAVEQPGSVPVYRCHDVAVGTHFASSASDCEGLGAPEFLLGYGLAP